MENCTIYSHKLNFDKVVEIVKSHLPKAKFDIVESGINKRLIATIKGGFFSKDKTLKINYRERTEPSYNLDNAQCGLSQNLVGMTNFVNSFATDNANLKSQLIYKIMSCNSEMPFIVEPGFNVEFAAILKDVTSAMDAIVFAQPSAFFNKSIVNHFTDKDLNLILDQSGNSEIESLEVKVDAKYHDQPKQSISDEQQVRKSNSEKILQQHHIAINDNLPPIASSRDTELRSVLEVSNRIHALMVVAAKGEGIEQEHLDRAIEGKKIYDLTPRESYIIGATELQDHERAYATWRYESLYTLLWAAGIMSELKYPSEICNVQEVVGAIVGVSRSDFDGSIDLRSKEEILDQLDLTYRMNWACVNARIKEEEVGGGIHPSIVYERHYALNWLTRYMDSDWDDVQTTT